MKCLKLLITLILLLWFGVALTESSGAKLAVTRLGLWRLDGEEKTYSLGASPLTVCLDLEEELAEPELRPIQGVIPTRGAWLKYLPWAGGLLSLLLVVLGLLRWYKRSRSRKRSIVLEDPPHIQARKQIEQLEAQGLFEQGEVKEFYFLLSRILRRYLESLRGFPAAEFTTEEIAGHIDTDQDRKLLPLLQHADLVKFAGTIPTPARKEEEVKKVLSYIEETSPTAETRHSTGGVQEVSQ